MGNNSEEERFVVSRGRCILSAKNLLEKRVFDVETWPFSPRGIISPDRENLYDKEKDAINKERDIEIKNLYENFSERLHDRQVTVISFILAMIIGVSGNLFVSLIFGTKTCRFLMQLSLFLL